MKKIHLLSALLCAFLLAGCDPNYNNDGANATDEQFAENFGAQVSRDFIGQVVDLNNHAVSGVTVSIGSSSVQTDANGIFILNNAEVHEKFAYITARKAGFMDGSRSMVPTSGKNNVKIMLVSATPVATIASGATAVADLPNGTKVTFDGAFQDENGQDYSGNVSVSMFHLEASNENIASLMPGMLYAKGDDGNPKVLQTFGMLNVELRGSAGQKLNIKQDHTAQLSMKIDDTQMANAPESIPLWHFDETAGYWKQDGTATKQGNFYVGNVSHFSWWNCDSFSSTVNLTLTVMTNYQSTTDSLSNIRVDLVRQLPSEGPISGHNYTDTNGQVSGMVPAGETFQLKIYDLCGEEIYSAPVGPFAQDTVLPNIVLANSPVMRHATGLLVDCGGAPVSNGYLTLHYASQVMFAPVSNGNFDFNVVTCDTNDHFTLEGIDYGSQQTTSAVSATFVSGVTNVGVLVACSSVSEFATYQIDNNPPKLFLNNVTKQGGTNADGEFHIDTPNYDEGDYTTGLAENFYGPDFNISFTPNFPENHGTYHIAGSIDPGVWRDFYFTGTYSQNGVQHDLTITIHSNH